MKNKCWQRCQEIYNIRHVTKSIKYLVKYLIPWRRRWGKRLHLTSDFSKFEFRSEDWDLVHQILSTIRAGTMSDVCQHLWRPWKLLFIYSCFENGCRKKCTRQSRKVLWVVLSSLFFKEIWKNGRRGMDLYLRVLKESNKTKFDSYSVRNSVLIISHVTFRDCRVYIFLRQPFSK